MDKKRINLNDIIWQEVNAMWFYQIIKDYELAGESLGMNYLTGLGSLRHNEKYFVGYIYNDPPEKLIIELVSYLQYKITTNQLILNYLEVAEKYRGNRISTAMIDAFSKGFLNQADMKVIATNQSNDGKAADLIGKFEEHLGMPVAEENKRRMN